MNRLGVALAADSAVTLGGGTGKIYTSAEKLFHLSNSAPVGLMIYGSADFVGLPWETIIKSYRGELGRKQFGRTEDYATDLLRFIKSNRTLFPDASQEVDNRLFLYGLFAWVKEKVGESLRVKEKTLERKLNDLDIMSTVKEIALSHLKFVTKQPYLRGISPIRRQRIFRKQRPLYARTRKDVFGDLPMSQSCISTMHKIAGEALVRSCFGPAQSGVVIAGFGEKDYTPALVSLKLEGLIDGQPRFAFQQEAKVDEKDIAFVMPFAQGEMVSTFMEGVNTDLKELIKTSTRTLYIGLLDAILNEVQKSDPTVYKVLRAAYAPKMEDLLKSMFQHWETRIKEGYVDPIMQVVSALPKDELAAMAESLVNLTKFKRRVSTQAESVGGPIDVAVITKGDGFVWVKRKHYFDPTLNPRVMASKFRLGEK